jgi:formate dehydrogenase subunit gamma
VKTQKMLRFDGVERAVHWCNATLFGILIVTGASLKIGSFAVLVAHRHLVKNIHVYTGLLLPVPLLIGLALPAGRMLRTDLGRLNRWSRDDKRWWSARERATGRVQLGKFNPGQKLNAIFIGAAIVVQLMTGSIMKWFQPFPNSWRTGATFVHDSTWLVLIVVIAGHIMFALRDQESLSSMLRGSVSERWARHERPAWWAEMVSARARSDVAARAEERLGEVRVGTGEVTVAELVDGGARDRLGGREL